MNMKKLLLLSLLVAAPIVVSAAEKSDKDKKNKPKPYTLQTCLVSDEKLGEMGDPYVFTHGDQEIKLCCKSCKKDFDKDPGKFVAKLAKGDKGKK